MDLEKVGNQFKDSVDYLTRNRMDISGVKVYGAVVFENLALEIESTILKLKRIKFNTPRDWTGVNFQTPQKADRTGIVAVYPSSPSTRVAKPGRSLAQEKF
ncbi:hypothetical protein EC957_004632 [Mortierella hygrophila]|uniref:Uncharacterized protein n=1 Tax=Mortierella hygrophila TaxID=979708 RepID=A0A9P6F0G5_9FUNG|nr:hypothetical protein EC957_004632 [Mortierella hygrophila]